MMYLASPYSHPDPLVRHERWEAVCRVAAEYIRAGVPAFSPIAHSHPIAMLGVDGDWETWASMDRAIIGTSDAMVVLMLDGWRDSKGIAAEILIAEELHLPIYMRLESDSVVRR